MNTQTMLPIILGEALLVCIVVIVILLIQLAKMRQLKNLLLKKLKSSSDKPPNAQESSKQAQDTQRQEDSPEDNNSEDTDNALNAAYKRIANLERFKQLYFDLEKKWSDSKQHSDDFYHELKMMGPQGEEAKENYELTLLKYHETYQGLGDIINNANTDSHPSSINKIEVNRLKRLTSEQNTIIDDLKNQLAKTQLEAPSAAQTESVVSLMENMEAELQKQARFMQESETCINLMEEELNAANKELISLKNRAELVPKMRQKIRAAQDAESHAKHIISSLKQDNRLQAKRIKSMSESAPESDPGVSKKLRRDLCELQMKYSELEESYLDLKTQG